MMKTNAEFDIVVYGASGLAGKYVLETIVKTLKKTDKKFTFAIAGRSEKKLDGVLQEIGKLTDEDLSQVTKIVAEFSSHTSLVNMAKRCKVVLNCVGPYGLYGRAVVQACIEGQASCLDLSGELDYLEGVQLDFDEAAKNAGVYIIGSCGWVSLPADMGVVHLKQWFESQGGQLDSVEEFVKTGNIEGKVVNKVQYATFAGIIHTLTNLQELGSIRERLAKKMVPVPPKPEFPLEMKTGLHHEEKVKSWCLPHYTADADVVKRSQNLLYRLRNQRPTQINSYVQLPSLFAAVGMVVSMFFMMLWLRLPLGLGKKLLLNYPGLMTLGQVRSDEDTTRENLDGEEFTLTLCGKGWSKKLADPMERHVGEPDKFKVLKVHGSNQAYGATGMIMLQAALSILNEREKMPENGGVFPPGAAFSETSLVERLKENGLSFQFQ